MFHFKQAQMRRFQKIPDSTSVKVLLSSVYGLPFLLIGDVLDAWTELKTRIWILYPTTVHCHHRLHHLLRGDLALLHLLPHLHVEHLFSSGVRRAQDQQRFRKREQRSEECLKHFTPIHVDLHINTQQVSCRGGDQVSTDVCWQATSEPVAKRCRVRIARIKHVVESYNPADKLDFLRKIGYLFEYKGFV